VIVFVNKVDEINFSLVDLHLQALL